VFNHYVDGEDVFDRLERYDNNRHFRFEVPADAFENLRSVLAEHGDRLVVVDRAEGFAVVRKKYTEHPETIVEQSVIHRGVDG
jgi:hypothetical protein